MIMSSSDGHVQLTVVGPAASGKTTFVSRILGEDPMSTTPTKGFDIKTRQYMGVNFLIFDIGGHEAYVETYWEKMISSANAIIFVLDGAAREKFELTRQLYVRVFQYMKDVPLLILINKCDRPDVADLEEIDAIVNFDQAKTRYHVSSYRIFRVSALTGEGIDEALDWLTSQVIRFTMGEPPVIYNMFVYQRSTGRPLAVINPWKIQADSGTRHEGAKFKSADPALLSAFYSALGSFSRELVPTNVQSLRIRNENVDNPNARDYMIFNYDDQDSVLSCLVIASWTPNEFFLEEMTKTLLNYLRENEPWMLDESTLLEAPLDITSAVRTLIDYLMRPAKHDEVLTLAELLRQRPQETKPRKAREPLQMTESESQSRSIGEEEGTLVQVNVIDDREMKVVESILDDGQFAIVSEETATEVSATSDDEFSHYISRFNVIRRFNMWLKNRRRVKSSSGSDS